MSPQTTVPKRVLAAIPDLFFSSKVSGAANQLGIDVQIANSRETLLQHAVRGADLLLIDLDASTLDGIGLVNELRSLNLPRPLRLVAFASHVHSNLLEAARSAGCDLVLTRGALAADLPRVLAAR